MENLSGTKDLLKLNVNTFESELIVKNLDVIEKVKDQ